MSTALALGLTPSGTVGLTLTAPGSWVFGDWVEFIAAAGSTTDIAGILIETQAGGSFEIQVGRGAAGAETPVATIRSSQDIGLCQSDRRLFVVAPCVRVAEGSRISARLAVSGTPPDTTTIKLLTYAGLESSVDYTPRILSAVPTGTDGVSVTPNGTAWANSAWVEVSAGLSDAVALTAVLLDAPLSVDNLWYEIDFGTGAAGSETVVATVKAYKQGSEGVWLKIPLVSVPASTRLAIRLRKEGTSVAPWTNGAIFYYGGLEFTVASCTGGELLTVDDPADGDTFEGLGPHEDRLFVETDLDDDEVARWALQTAMRDSPDLAAHPGYKDGVITTIGSIIRRTTGRLGGWQASTCRWVKDDHSRVARDMFNRLHWYGREFRVYLAKRANVAGARILGRFFTSNYEPTRAFGAEVEGLDLIGSEFSPLALDRDILAGSVFDRDRVPEAPVALLDLDPPQPIPIYMGRWSDEASAAAPLTLIGAAWRKAAFDVYWFMGFGNMLSVGGVAPPPAPTSIALTLLSGGSIQVSPLSSRLCIQVWAVTAGVEGDPAPFLGRDASITITGDNRVQVDITWAGADPDTWRIGVAYFYFLERWQQVIEIAGSLRTFIIDNTPILNGAGAAASGGTQIPIFFDRHAYKVVKVTADGRTAASAICHMNTGPYRRPAHVSFQDPDEASALRYEGYGTTLDPQQFPKAKDFFWRWTAPVDQIDSDGYHYFLDHFDATGRETLTEGMPVPLGMIPVYDTGDVVFDGQLMGRLVMARWAWHLVISVFAGEVRLADDHPDLRHADHALWPLASRVVTLGDTDCMVLYVRVGSEILTNHRDGTAVIRVNACTTEEFGDGTGSTISQSAYAVRHLWERLIIQDHKSGVYPASPIFGDGTAMVRGSDYEAARLMQIQRIGGDGYPARIALDVPTTIGQFVEWVVQSYGLHHGIGWHGQIRAGHYDDSVDTTQGYPHFTHVRTVKGHLTIKPLTSDYENAIPGEWDYRPVDREFVVRLVRPSDMLKDDASIARNFGKRRVGPTRSLRFAGNEATFTDVMQRNLLLGRFVNEWVEVPTDLEGLSIDLFSIIAVSDPEGTGANGYLETFILVLEHEVQPGDPSQQRPTLVILKGLNITKLIDAAWVWAPDSAPATWDELTSEEQGQYAGWADTDDTIPTDDAAAKEWR